MIQATLRDVFTSDELTPDQLASSFALRVRTPVELRLRDQQLAIRSEHGLETVTFGDGPIVLELVADREEMVSIVTKGQLEDAAIEVDDAYRMAAAALARATHDGRWKKLADDIWVSAYDDDYDFARLVAAGPDGRLPFASAPRVFAPSHSVCLATSAEDDATLGTMLGHGYELAKNHRPFSHLLWTRGTAGAWTDWQPRAGAPGFRTAELQRIRQQLADYNEQQGILKEALEARGEDSFVASYTAFERGDGYRTVCTYTLNLPSYLPKTDLVAIFDPTAGSDGMLLGQVTWRDFEAAVGIAASVPLADEEPARFALTTKLDEAQERTLRQLARPIE